MTLIAVMALQAALAGLLCRKCRKRAYFGRIAAALNMFFTRTVTGFTAMPLRSFVFGGLGPPMRTAFVACGLRRMTCLACIRSYV